MTKPNATSWGYTIRTGYQRQYRSKPRDKHMSWGNALLLGAVIAGFWMLCWCAELGVI